MNKVLSFIGLLVAWGTVGTFVTIGVRFGLSSSTPTLEVLAVNGLLVAWLALPITGGIAIFSELLNRLRYFHVNIVLWVIFLICVLVLDTVQGPYLVSP